MLAHVLPSGSGASGVLRSWRGAGSEAVLSQILSARLAIVSGSFHSIPESSTAMWTSGFPVET